ncbi:MAG: hypothetical protein LUD50_06865 [Clostridia bacterium]|nr:hypothetical protein [Clostridia bacterium]
MRKERKFGAMLWVCALAILVFGAGLLLLAFYMSFEIGVIVSITAAVAVAGVVIAAVIMKAVRRRREARNEDLRESA